MQVNKFSGTGVAIITPFRKNESIDFKALEKHINHLISNEIDYIVVLGTTGETPVLSKDEKKAVTCSLVEVVNKRVPVVLGIGGNYTNTVINDIKDTDFTGIDAVLSVTPPYNKPNQTGLYLHYKAIAETSPVPVIVYNVPGRTGSNISADTIVKLSNDFKQIIAVKEASGNMQQIMNILKYKPDSFQLISGDDSISLPLISLGASGVISVIANAFPLEFSRMVRYCLSGKMDEARKIHYKLLPLMEALFSEGSPAGVKAILEIIGISSNYLRLPLVPVSRELYKKLEKMTGVIKSNQ